jgi:glutamate/aspartate transport system substrate-binding protein
MFRTTALTLVLLLAAGALSAQNLDGRLKRIASTKTVTIAYRTDATPFSFMDESKQVRGFSIDLCKYVVSSIESQINLTGVQVKWLPVTSQTRFDAVAKGQADMECGASTVTLARLKQVDFSSYIYVESTGLLTKSAAGLRSLPDLAGKRISVIAGTTNEKAIKEQLSRRQINATVLPFKTREEALNALVEDKADAFASDKLLLVGAAGRAKDQKFYILPDELSIEPYGIVLPRGDHALRLAVNTALARIYGSGEIIQIYNQWFGQFGEPGPVVKVMYLLGAIPE